MQAQAKLSYDEFIEHVSRDIVRNETMPDDFESTLWYVLYQLPARNREIFLLIERDGVAYRTVGAEYGVTGQRIYELNKTTIETMLRLWGSFLREGIMQSMRNSADASQAIGEANAKDRYYKLGYTAGYADGSHSKLQQHFATEELNAISLSDLTLSYRTYHYLFDAGLLNLSQIIEYGDKIMFIPHIGKLSCAELIDRLAEFGVDVKKHFPKTIKKHKINVEG